MTTLDPHRFFRLFGLALALALVLVASRPGTGHAQDAPRLDAPPAAAEAEDADDEEGEDEGEGGEGDDDEGLEEPSAPLDAPPMPEAPGGADEAGLAAPPPASATPPAVADESVDTEAEIEALEEAAEAPAAPPPPKVWRNSFFFWSNDVTVYSFTPEGQLTYNPQYSMSFSVQPRWYLGPSLFLRLRQDATIEWTLPDDRTRTRELVFADTQVDILEGNLASIAGITFSLGGRLILPTSIVSQNNTMIVGLAGLGLARYSMDVLGGLTWIVSGAYTYRHFDSNVPTRDEADSQPPVSVLGGSGSAFGGPPAGTLANQAHTAGLGVSGVLGLTSELFLSGSFSWSRGWGLGPTPIDCVVIDSGCAPLSQEDDENRRDSTFFSLGASYQFNKWLNVGLSINTFKLYGVPGFNERNPLFNRDSTISLTTQITLDQLYTDLFESQAGGRVALPGQPF